MKVVLLILGGAIGGAILLQLPGAILGFLLGLLYSEFFNLKERVAKLETQLERKAVTESEEETSVGAEEPIPPAVEPVLGIKEIAKEALGPTEGKAAPVPVETNIPAEIPAPVSTTPATSPLLPISDSIYSSSRFIKDFFTTGNVVAKVGMIILFFGIGFLLKFISQKGLLPIEVRLSGVAVGSLLLLVTGWRIRTRRLGYGLILQGGGIGILYLNLFATAKMYDLIPIGLAFGVMVGLVVLSAILAVLQNSKALAGFGAVGGFLAPVLMSTGSGNHVILFSYYGFINAGILGIAWFRAWRELNLIGFVFTFVIGLLWGNQYYQPSYFQSTEPFLVLFFLFYVAISLLFAHRQPFHMKGYLDSTLVFGTPIIAFGLQYGLVRDFEYGLATSALILGVFYILLATSLWKRKIEGMRMLTEAFLAMGVVFGSLAIPLALDGRWTASSWTLEGAALVWVGLHQRRLLARNFGLLLQIGATVSFATSLQDSTGSIPVLNSFYISSLLISLSAFFSSYMLLSSTKILRDWEQYSHLIMLILGLFWWFVSGYNELNRHLSTTDLNISLLVFVSLSSFVMSFLAIRLRWQTLQFPQIGLLPCMVMLLVSGLIMISDFHPFIRWGIIGWLIAFPVHYWHLFYFEKIWPQKLISLWHLISLWFLIVVLTLEVRWLAYKYYGEFDALEFMSWAFFPGIFALMLMKLGEKIRWPVLTFPVEYKGTGLAALMCFMTLWHLAACFMSGDFTQLLPYLPILSPMDLIQLFAIFLSIQWALLNHRHDLPTFKYMINQKTLIYIPASLFFAWLNALVARTVHFYGDVPYSTEALFSSIVFQASISIVWALSALFTTVWATRKGIREVWFTGAALLSLVVVKLFVVDLASTGTIARIISFLVVGGLMLLIGYMSPLPVREEENQ